jgi:hypothetical protein
VTQWPATHEAFAAQATLQPPQLRRSRCSSTQPVPQVDSPDAHDCTQLPAWHSSRGWQVLPHAPQFFASAAVFAQVPSAQVVNGALQAHCPC